jgi:AbrB family looped-hinge helix DNA binding protein
MHMPIKFEVSVMQVGNSLRITVPKEVAKHLQLKKGDRLIMYSDNAHVVLEKKEGT